MTKSIGFPPIAKSDATVLILGSMPGQKSLEEKQYYAHPRNSFWPIICKLFRSNENISYIERKQLLYDNKIAVWDVLKQCYREGSLDSGIDPTSIETNDFDTFLKKQPNIKHVFFNGAKAEQLFKKKVLKSLDEFNYLTYYKLPSTSPAHAAISKEQKIEEWKIIKSLT